MVFPITSPTVSLVTPTPLLSIVMPLFNDEATLAASLQSVMNQTLSRIEIICVDDASTDGTVGVIERLAASDLRVRLVRHERNASAFQARRTGILAAQAPYVLFLDGDDELVPHAASRALDEARRVGSDLVGFGVTVIEKDGRTGGSYEARLQPRHQRLEGAEVLAGLFPVGMPAQGQLWRYLFRTSILREAYALMPQDVVLPRVNDLPLMFLVAALATKYVSIEEKLYRYHFGRGGSGHTVDSVERAEFYASAIRSIESIQGAVEALAQGYATPDPLRAAYDSARLSIIGYVCSQLLEKSVPSVLDAAIAHLYSVASAEDVLRGAGQFYPRTLVALKPYVPWQSLGEKSVRSIMLATSMLRTGGVSAVITSQAQYLREAGYQVTVVARSGGSEKAAIPSGITFIELTKRDLVGRLEEWAEICRVQQIDVVIDHQVLYTQYWPEFALMARAQGAATVGWLHNFVGRPIYDGTLQLTHIEQYSNTLAKLVTLSPLDVAYFKLRGVKHASYLPNPPSPLLRESLASPVKKQHPTGTIKLVWWGRLEQHTKRVGELISVAAHLERLGIDFRLTVVGPDWDDLTAKKFNMQARKSGVGERVRAIGPRHGEELLREIDNAHAFVSTSIIEGYQLTIAEAQARGLPVFMYDLPWLTLVQKNEGIVSVKQGDAGALAREIADVLRSPERYDALSNSSLVAARRALDRDFASLYEGTVTGVLPAQYSPEPNLEDARQLLGLMVFFAERGRGRRTGAFVASANPSAFGARMWARAAPFGRKALRRVPALRPLAHRLKGLLKAR